MSREPATRPRLLVANFFPAFHPPRSGGEQRYFYLYRHLSEHYDVTLLSPTYSHHRLEEVRFGPTFREIRVPKDPIFDRLHVELDTRGIGPECSAYVVALAAAVETEYSRQFARAVAAADVVVHEFPYTLPYDRTFGADGRPRIYNAHNVEHRLAQQILRGEVGQKAVEYIRFLEATLVRNATRVFATCEEDRLLLAADFDVAPGRIGLVPNGFEPEGDGHSGEQVRSARVVTFVGSAHPPNVEAARFIADRLAPALSDLEFRIVGSAGDKLGGDLPRNVHRLGVIDDVAKARELARCTIAINPMFSGSGTNLKSLDYLAAGAPALMTPVGARGLGLVNGKTAFIASSDEFAARLASVIGDPVARSRVATEGRSHAFAHFTWQRIADGAREAIDAVIAADMRKRRRRPLLLAVNDFPVADAKGGGEARIRELLAELARGFEVVLLCLSDELRRSERRIRPHFHEIRIPKSALHRDADVAANRGETVSVGDLVASEFCEGNVEFVTAFAALAARAAAVIFEHPYLSPLAKRVPSHVPLVYSSLNFETALKAELLQARRDARHRVEQVRALETGLLRRAKLVVCVSEADRQAFAGQGVDASIVVVENGVRVAGRTVAARTDGDDERTRGILAVFLGSAHPPNVEAARFLIATLAPAVPALEIVLVGGVCSGVGAMPLPPNVHLAGLLSEAEKNALLARADIALNPLFGGGGSSLKVPDFFASGLAVVSTATGVRGYDVSDGVHYVEATRESFVARTREVVADVALRARLGRHARDYTERRLDWSVIGRRYREAMRNLLDVARRPRVLTVTYRFADPPPGGAETFLVNVLKVLAERGNLDVDVATCDVGEIRNHWHFSAQYAPGVTHADPAFVDNVFRFPVDVGNADDFEACRRLFACWMAETREQALELADLVDGQLLLGGWNFAERRDGNVVRWTSRAAQVHVPERARAMRVRAYSPQSGRIDLRCKDEIIATRTFSGRFEWSIGLPDGRDVVVLDVAKTYQAEGDPRELGILVEAIEFDDGGGWRSLPLDEDFEAVARRKDVARWVGSLVGIAQRRDPGVDALFQRVRGPHAKTLADWLELHVSEYDVVLAHGTPFSTAVVAADAAKRHGVPVVALPHVHMEDRYYHWQTYFAMFRAAHRVIAAPSSAKALFFDRIGASSLALPGGGVDAGEFTAARLERARIAFAALHSADKPFVLVLGRKTAAKRYRMVVEAVDALNAGGRVVDLVVIGPDEDGQPIASSHVYAYGARSRDVVLGALSRALCIANMSESESFGIVLLEAWLAGRPVVAARKCAAFTDLVVNGQNGFLADTAGDVARALETYLRDEALATRHGGAGRTLAQQYRWDEVAARVEDVLLDARRAAKTHQRGVTT